MDSLQARAGMVSQEIEPWQVLRLPKRSRGRLVPAVPVRRHDGDERGPALLSDYRAMNAGLGHDGGGK